MKFLVFFLWASVLGGGVALSLTPNLIPAAAGTDKIAHVFSSCLLTLFFFRCARSRRVKVLVVFFLLLAGIVGEFLQEITGGRTGSVSDMLANGCGVIVGLFVAYLLRSGWNAAPRESSAGGGR